MGRLSARAEERALKRVRLSLDVLLVRAAHVAQVALVALAVFGYFYTVRPIHQKEVLDEEIAQKRLELREKEKQINELGESIRKTSQELKEREALLASARTEASSARSEAREVYDTLLNEYVGALSAEFVRCGHVALDKELDGSEMKMCPSNVVRNSEYMLGKLKPKDREALTRRIREAASRAERPYAAMVARLRTEAENLGKQISDVQRQIDGIRAQRDEPSSDLSSRLKAMAAELPLRQQLDQLRIRQHNARIEAFREFTKLLEAEAEKIRTS